MNLSDMDDADAKRLVDFAAGLTFGLHGRIERVTAKVFLLSPHNVSVTAQDKAQDRERLLQPELSRLPAGDSPAPLAVPWPFGARAHWRNRMR